MSFEDEKRTEETETKYNGEEKRKDYCPVHHLKCYEIRDLKRESDKRLPIWVFIIFISCLTGVLGFLNYDLIKRHNLVIETLDKHTQNTNALIDDSKTLLNRVTHSLNEVTLNQREVMEKLEIKFRHIPKYDNGYKR